MSVVVGLFFLIAILYSSVGFGGGSGYLAILSNVGMEQEKMRFIALSCNILVVSYSTAIYLKKKVFNFQKIPSLVILSVPMAMLGGSISLTTNFFFMLLGGVLLLSGALMLRKLFVSKEYVASKVVKKWKWQTMANVLVGGFIGFISGLVGIGGGIFLAPLLHLSKWDKPAAITAAASFFILVNSVAGLLGQVSAHSIPVSFSELLYPMLAVVAGSIIGVNVTMKWLKEKWVVGATAVLVIVAAMRILVLHFG